MSREESSFIEMSSSSEDFKFLIQAYLFLGQYYSLE